MTAWLLTQAAQRRSSTSGRERGPFKHPPQAAAPLLKLQERWRESELSGHRSQNATPSSELSNGPR